MSAESGCRVYVRVVGVIQRACSLGSTNQSLLPLETGNTWGLPPPGREGVQPAVFSIPSCELTVRLCSVCPFWASADFFNFDRRAELQRLSEENFVLRSDLGKIQLELETSESRNEVQR